MEFNVWKQEVVEELQERFGLSKEDCIGDRVLHMCCDNGETPYEVVDQIGKKYALTDVRVTY